ncbi:MAG: hypothetical protein UZ17_ACD001000912 [Acidobacteria bacterium OLB17]|nr:MAG: hypothetical protein UZ17_ACD001000912 [Acidobacteria bacterium OLB17]
MAKQVRTLEEPTRTVKRRNKGDRLLEDPDRVLGQAHLLICDRGVVFRIKIFVRWKLIGQAEFASHILDSKSMMCRCLVPDGGNFLLDLVYLRPRPNSLSSSSIAFAANSEYSFSI